MAGLMDMAGLTPPMGQWAGQMSPLGQNTLEIPQAPPQPMQHMAQDPQMRAMAQALQHYLLTGQAPKQEMPQYTPQIHRHSPSYGSGWNNIHGAGNGGY